MFQKCWKHKDLQIFVHTCSGLWTPSLTFRRMRIMVTLYCEHGGEALAIVRNDFGYSYKFTGKLSWKKSYKKQSLAWKVNFSNTAVDCRSLLTLRLLSLVLVDTDWVGMVHNPYLYLTCQRKSRRYTYTYHGGSLASHPRDTMIARCWFVVISNKHGIQINGTHEEFYFVHKHMEKSRNDGFKLDFFG